MVFRPVDLNIRLRPSDLTSSENSIMARYDFGPPGAATRAWDRRRQTPALLRPRVQGTVKEESTMPADGTEPNAVTVYIFAQSGAGRSDHFSGPSRSTKRSRAGRALTPPKRRTTHAPPFISHDFPIPSSHPQTDSGPVKVQSNIEKTGTVTTTE